ncbi:unnamed protein product [Allacma fusca]|uniref:Uncharacterized protein n=1 Tax=Allacma fusca TaxID=39272 RepID=A0A8J2PJR8_9HEXA|nr:unnamed protein product [Allacma fusca]
MPPNVFPLVYPFKKYVSCLSIVYSGKILKGPVLTPTIFSKFLLRLTLPIFDKMKCVLLTIGVLIYVAVLTNGAPVPVPRNEFVADVPDAGIREVRAAQIPSLPVDALSVLKEFPTGGLPTESLPTVPKIPEVPAKK